MIYRFKHLNLIKNVKAFLKITSKHENLLISHFYALVLTDIYYVLLLVS